MMQEALDAADEVLEALKAKGIDLSEHREQIAKELFDDGLLEGNWDCTTEVGSHTIRAIQEDEYDQHMDDVEDKPEFDDQLVYVVTVPAYIWLS